jgi:hypothetical protein
MNVRGVISQVRDDRDIATEISATAPCTLLGAWSARIPWSRTQRFKVGTARVTG